MALLVIAQLALGWWMLGLLMLLRLGWRLGHRPPDFAAAMPRWQQRAARATHALLYLCLLVLPLSGYLGSRYSGYPIRFFGIALPGQEPAWPAAKAAMSALHLGSVCVLLALLALHVGAALHHHLWRRDATLARMSLFAASEDR